MQEIASAIRTGADAFIRYEYKVLLGICIVVAIVLAIVVSWQAGCCFVLGATMSGCAGWFGMKSATYSNVRVSMKHARRKVLAPH